MIAQLVVVVALVQSQGGVSAQMKPDRPLAMTIPMKGVVGVDITNQGLAACLDWAKKRNVRKIIIEIDSEGGLTDEAQQLRETFDKYSPAFEYHIVVHRAISAAVIPVLCADEIWVCNDAQIGAATSYLHDHSNGDVQVDAKMNSIWAAFVADCAQAKGRSPTIARAMVEMGRTVFVWRNDHGNVEVSEQLPEGENVNVILADGAETIVALTDDESIEIGWALPVKDFEAIRAGWRFVSADRGEMLMTKAKRPDPEKLTKEILQLVENIQSAVSDAEKRHPMRFTYQITDRGYFWGMSRIDWQKNCDAARQAWQLVSERLDRLTTLEAARQRAGYPAIVYELNVDNLRRRLADELDWLQRNYRRDKPGW